MTRGIYGHTLQTVLTLMNVLEDGSAELDEAGITVGPIALFDNNGNEIGTIYDDFDGHPVWRSAQAFNPGIRVFDREAVNWDEVYSSEEVNED